MAASAKKSARMHGTALRRVMPRAMNEASAML
jgi:hypothetical protein